MGIIQSIQGLNRTKAQGGGICPLFCLKCLNCDIASHLLLPWDQDFYCPLPWFLGIWTQPMSYHWLSGVSSLQQLMRLLSLHNYNQSIIKNLLLVLLLWKILANTKFKFIRYCLSSFPAQFLPLSPVTLDIPVFEE